MVYPVIGAQNFLASIVNAVYKGKPKSLKITLEIKNFLLQGIATWGEKRRFRNLNGRIFLGLSKNDVQR